MYSYIILYTRFCSNTPLFRSYPLKLIHTSIWWNVYVWWETPRWPGPIKWIIYKCKSQHHFRNHLEKTDSLSELIYIKIINVCNLWLGSFKIKDTSYHIELILICFFQHQGIYPENKTIKRHLPPWYDIWDWLWFKPGFKPGNWQNQDLTGGQVI